MKESFSEVHLTTTLKAFVFVFVDDLCDRKSCICVRVLTKKKWTCLGFVEEIVCGL
jgi:hypothetical protein